MQYSDTTNKNGIIQRYERHTLLGDGVVSGDDTILKQATADINETIYDLTTLIIASNDNFDFDDPNKTDYPIATTPLVAGQRDYQFDSISFLKLKRVDVTWDGTNYYKAEPFDSATYQEGLGNDAQTDKNFSKLAPAYDPKGFGFWLYPLADAADVTAGAKARIEFTRAYDEFTYSDVTAVPPIERPFHDLIAIGAALKNPSLPDKQYQKLVNLYGQERGDGTWTGLVGQMIASYGNRNEDFVLSLSPQLENYR